MSRAGTAFLWARVVWELVRYDLLYSLRGLHSVHSAGRCCPSAAPGAAEVPAAICEAVAAVAPLYWKPIRCLQRSVVTARLMRHYGVAAEVVIGYRPNPFFSHAWVEVDGRVVNDSPRFQRRLQILERF